eukprot:gene46990-60719_t
MRALAEMRAKVESSRLRLLAALRYPAFVLGAATIVLGFFLGFVLPQFGSTLRDLGPRMDRPTAFLLFLSDLVEAHGAWFLAMPALLAACFALVWRHPPSRRRMFDLVLRLPAVGRLVRDHQTAIFCWSLGHLVSSGTRLDTALPLAADTMGEDAGTAFAPAFAKLRQG